MQLRTVFFALVAGVATTLLVGVAVTEALLSSIAFSALVALPVGVSAGLLVGALVLLGLAGPGVEAGHHNAATAVGLCGLVLLATFALAVVVDLGATVGLLGGAIAGLLAGIAGFVRLQRRDATAVHAVTSQ